MCGVCTYSDTTYLYLFPCCAAILFFLWSTGWKQVCDLYKKSFTSPSCFLFLYICIVHRGSVYTQREPVWYWAGCPCCVSTVSMLPAAMIDRIDEAPMFLRERENRIGETNWKRSPYYEDFFAPFFFFSPLSSEFFLFVYLPVIIRDWFLTIEFSVARTQLSAPPAFFLSFFLRFFAKKRRREERKKRRCRTRTSSDDLSFFLSKSDVQLTLPSLFSTFVLSYYQDLRRYTHTPSTTPTYIYTRTCM